MRKASRADLERPNEMEAGKAVLEGLKALSRDVMDNMLKAGTVNHAPYSDHFWCVLRCVVYANSCGSSAHSGCAGP